MFSIFYSQLWRDKYDVESTVHLPCKKKKIIITNIVIIITNAFE